MINHFEKDNNSEKIIILIFFINSHIYRDEYSIMIFNLIFFLYYNMTTYYI